MAITVLVGNPRARSRTYQAAHVVAEQLTGRKPDLGIDLVDIGPALLDWSDDEVTKTVAAVQASKLLIVASPTYKATYTGLLKLFLDRVPAAGLAGVTTVPLMVGGDWRHSLASDLLLKPVLVELGATCPTRGLFVLDSEVGPSTTLTNWLTVAGPQVAATAGDLR